MAGTFSATQLQNTKASVQSAIETITADVAKLASVTSEISGLVAAGSGSLAGSWSNISNTYKSIGNGISGSAQTFVQNLMDYAQATIENEVSNSSKLQTINSALEDIKSKLGGL